MPERLACCIQAKSQQVDLLCDLVKDGVDVKTVSELKLQFDSNWPAVKQWISRVAPELNQLNRALLAIADPYAIVFRGEAPDILKQLLIESCDPGRVDRYGHSVAEPSLVLSKLCDDSSLIGAGINAMRFRVLDRYFLRFGGKLELIYRLGNDRWSVILSKPY